MITWKEYRKHPLSWWGDRVVENTERIENRFLGFPAGLRWRIVRKYKGFTLRRVNECALCGIREQQTIARVSPVMLDLVEEPEGFSRVGSGRGVRGLPPP